MSQPDRYPTFSDAEFTRRLAAVRARMDEHDCDALLLYGAGRVPDIQYLSNWPGTRESFLVVPRHGDPTLLVQLYNHVPTAQRVAITKDVRWAGSWAPEALRSVLAEVPIHEGIVGLAGPWPSRIVDDLGILLARIGLVDASGIVADLRTVKSTEELERLRIAARLTDAAMHALAHDGATVSDVLDAAEIIHERRYTIYDDLLHGTGQLPPIIQTRRTKRGDWAEDFIFRENMVVVVQPNVVTDESGRIGLQVGETVRITKTGIERLHDYPMEFVRVG